MQRGAQAEELWLPSLPSPGLHCVPLHHLSDCYGPQAACQVILHKAFLQRPVTTHTLLETVGRQGREGGAGCYEGVRAQEATQVGHHLTHDLGQTMGWAPALSEIPQQGWWQARQEGRQAKKLQVMVCNSQSIQPKSEGWC